MVKKIHRMVLDDQQLKDAPSEFVNMENICHRYVIEYFHSKGFGPTNQSRARFCSRGVHSFVYNNKILDLNEAVQLKRRTSQWPTNRGDHVRNGEENPHNGIG